VITGPQLIVSIQPDATKPVSFNISYKPRDTYTVGESLPGNTLIVSVVKHGTVSVQMCVWYDMIEQLNIGD